MGEDFLFTDKQIQGPNDFKGGLSDNLYNNPVITQYILTSWIETESFTGYNVFGYLGSYKRTEEQDKQVESLLRSEGFTIRRIAKFLISKEGRHFADSLTHKSINEALKNFL